LSADFGPIFNDSVEFTLDETAAGPKLPEFIRNLFKDLQEKSEMIAEMVNFRSRFLRRKLIVS
jgi:hypothetical protein